MLTNEEMLNVKGGALNLTATLLNSFSRFISTVFELGQAIGSALRRTKEKKICSI